MFASIIHIGKENMKTLYTLYNKIMGEIKKTSSATNIFDYHDTILKGLLTGVLIAYLLIYGLRPSVPYPDLILEFFENKWIFLILIIVIYYALIWDLQIGLLLILCTIALIFDYVIFTDLGAKSSKDYIKNETTFENNFPTFI